MALIICSLLAILAAGHFNLRVDRELGPVPFGPGASFIDLRYKAAWTRCNRLDAGCCLQQVAS
jgi:hypothetical protein